jgi:4'-phosphopantetheinyl transferase EntD
VLAVAASDAEQAALAALAGLREQRPAVEWDRLLFSAKESAYKSWFPLTGTWLDFEQVQIDFRLDRNAFTAHLAVTDPWLRRLPGRWAWGDGLLVTAVVVPAPRR